MVSLGMMVESVVSHQAVPFVQSRQGFPAGQSHSVRRS